MKKGIFIFVLLITCCSFSDNIRVVSVKPTPQPDNLKLRIIFPKPNSVDLDNKLDIQLRLRGYALGVDSQFDRNKEIENSPKGQSLHVIIDDKSYFEYVGPRMSPFEDQGDYYEGMYKFKCPFFLKEGIHYIRIFPARSFYESLKLENSFASACFYVKKKEKGCEVLKEPFITYNMPNSQVKYTKKEPILLDFLISNCELSRDGYKVRLIIDKTIKRILVKWQPYYIYGLSEGNHTFKLELLDQKNNKVDNVFAKCEGQITLEK